MRSRAVAPALVCGLLVLIFTIVGVDYSGLSTMRMLHQRAASIRDNQWQDVQLATTALNLSSQNSRILLELAVVHDREEINSILLRRQENSEKVDEIIDKLRGRIRSTEERRRYDAIVSTRASYLKSADLALAPLLAGNAAKTRELLLEDTMPLLALHHMAWNDFIDFQKGEMSRQLDLSSTEYTAARMRAIYLIWFSVLLALAIAIVLIQRILAEIHFREIGEHKIQRLNEELERKVSNRTIALETANEDLTAEVSQRRRIEEQLRAETAFLEAQTNSTLDGILVVDDNNRVLLRNRRFAEVMQVPTSLCETDDDEVMLKHALTQVANPDEFLLKVRYLYDHRHETSCDEIKFKNGRVVDRYSSPVIDKEGKYYGRIWTFRDITERKQDEQKLRRSQAYLAESQKLSHIGSWAWKTNQRESVYWSEEHYRIFGLEPGDGVVPFQKSLVAIHPDDLAGFVHVVRQSMAEKKDYETDARIVLPDGSIRNIHGIGHPILDESGELVEFLGLSQDVTERKRREEEVRRLSLAVEQCPVSVVITDLNGDIVYVNRKFVECTGYSYDEAIGKNPRILKSGTTKEDAYKKLWQTIQAGDEWRGEFQNRKKNGEPYWEYAVIRPIKDESGKATHFLALKEDITERRKMEVQLQQAQRLEAIGQLASGIAHEINTPTQYIGDNVCFLTEAFGDLISLIRDYERRLEVAINRPANGSGGDAPCNVPSEINAAGREIDATYLLEEIPKALSQTKEGISRVAKLVSAMKEFSHPGSKEKTACDLNRAIQSTITVSRNEWKYVSQVEADFDPSLPLVSCVPSELNQVILNMIVNAAHAIGDVVKRDSGNKGKILIKTLDCADWVEVRVQDTGSGIPTAVRDRIFEPFFTTKEVGRGTGQGLAIARSIIVDNHQGTIHFETEEGNGTTFIIRLPKDGKTLNLAARGVSA